MSQQKKQEHFHPCRNGGGPGRDIGSTVKKKNQGRKAARIGGPDSQGPGDPLPGLVPWKEDKGKEFRTKRRGSNKNGGPWAIFPTPTCREGLKDTRNLPKTYKGN